MHTANNWMCNALNKYNNITNEPYNVSIYGCIYLCMSDLWFHLKLELKIEHSLVTRSAVMRKASDLRHGNGKEERIDSLKWRHSEREVGGRISTVTQSDSVLFWWRRKKMTMKNG